MNVQAHDQLKNHIWDIANRLRGPYRPPQYRLVMLPMVVLRRLDSVLEPTKDAVLKEYEKLTAQNMPESAMDRLLGRAADPARKHPLYNTSPFTFGRLLGDAENIAPNLVAYINGFSPTARSIFERFKFADQIEKLDASNRLFTIVKAMADVDLHPDRIDNMQMGYLFEHLVMRFNEQANEEAGDHFTPREVIRLMANLVYTGEQDVYTPGIYRTIYDPACGTGGMLSESEKFILAQNESANLALFGQEYNDESWAICCSDMLIKDEETSNIVLGDTLGDGKTRDGFEGERFHYLLANPPFGVEWKDQKTVVEAEHKLHGFSGRFGAGLPAINDGSLLFLQHMISKMHPSPDNDGEGSKIAIVFNGSPLFSGDAGSGPSNVRRWIIENDWLDAIVALPDQLFYNTGIFTYVWLVTNRKPPERRGKVQLIDGTRFFQRMKKSLNNKRNEITEDQIRHLTRIYGAHKDGETAQVRINGETETRVVSRIFENREFGFLKVTVERPLRMNFEATTPRTSRCRRGPRCHSPCSAGRTSPMASSWRPSATRSTTTWRRRCCPTCLTPGWTTTRPGSATRSRSTGTSTCTSRRARSTRSSGTSRSLRVRSPDYLKGWSHERPVGSAMAEGPAVGLGAEARRFHVRPVSSDGRSCHLRRRLGRPLRNPSGARNRRAADRTSERHWQPEAPNHGSNSAGLET